MIRQTVKDIPLIFETSAAVFSPSAVDRGTLAMLSAVEFRPQDKVLDLGCGYGAVGILAAKLIGGERVVLSDEAGEAVALAKANAVLNGVSGVNIVQSDAFDAIEDRDFTLILSNPPYHADFSVAKRFIENGFQRLAPGGRMVMVTKRLDWYRNKFTSVFGGVTVSRRDGYYVFTAEKRGAAPPRRPKKAAALSRKLKRKYGRQTGGARK